jgi:hypothetical protein
MNDYALRKHCKTCAAVITGDFGMVPDQCRACIAEDSARTAQRENESLRFDLEKVILTQNSTAPVQIKIKVIGGDSIERTFLTKREFQVSAISPLSVLAQVVSDLMERVEELEKGK